MKTTKRCARCDRPIGVKKWVSGSDPQDWQHYGKRPFGMPEHTVVLPAVVPVSA